MVALMHAPENPEYASWIDRALTLPRGRDVEELALAAIYYGWRGELSELRTVIDAWKRRAAREPLGGFAELSLCCADMVQALFSGDFERSSERAREGMELVERTGVYALGTTLRVYHAYEKLALGDASSIALIVDEMAQDAESGRIHLVNYHFLAGYEAMLRGDLAHARSHIQSSVEHTARLGAPSGVCVHGIGLAEVLWHSGELRAAKEQLERMKPLAKSISRIMLQGATLIEAGVTLSDDTMRGEELLAEAFALGAKWRFVPLPWPIRPALAQLCRHAERRGIELEYVRELTRKFAFGSSSAELGPRSAQRAQAALQSPPAEFSRAVRQALRRLHETGKLAHNPLISSQLVRERAGAHATLQAQVEALQVLLRESVVCLAQSARTDAAHRAMLHTYLEPAATQLLAAEAAKMSFGTYRRHLGGGLDEVTAALWLKEQAIGTVVR
jgi:hypothetical protein